MERISDALEECDQNSDCEELERDLVTKLSSTPKQLRATPKSRASRTRIGDQCQNLQAKFVAMLDDLSLDETEETDQSVSETQGKL